MVSVMNRNLEGRLATVAGRLACEDVRLAGEDERLEDILFAPWRYLTSLCRVCTRQRGQYLLSSIR